MRKSLITLVTAAAMCSSPTMASTPTQTPPGNVPLLFLADPQIHNLHGTSLKQMFPAADWVAKVAIRPPELNLLAPLALRHALATGRQHANQQNNLVVVLGDGTNIGCSGEADAFDDEFIGTGRDTLRLMAHGNHDSYMMGTVNSYGPKGPNTWTPGRMMTSDLPVDEAWWTPTDSPERTGTSARGRNWLDACYQPVNGAHAAGTPMNKVRWLARYAESLARHGLVQEPAGAAPREGLKFVGRAAPGTALAALNYRSRGIWYRPRPKTPHRRENYARSWNSFLVQAIDIGERHSLILIDTSVCPNARGGFWFAFSNAGQYSCIGESQFEVIKGLLDSVSNDRHVIFAGHFPLEALGRSERKRLIGLMAGKNPSGWTYVSGHTHETMKPRAYASGTDMNIGSTTDWPMESHVLHFDADSSRIVDVQSTILGNAEGSIDYVPGVEMAGTYSELCRHIAVASALANATEDRYNAPWVSPPMTRCEDVQRNWADNAATLMADQRKISDRFDDKEDVGYAAFILRVAEAASRHEHRKNTRRLRLIP